MILPQKHKEIIKSLVARELKSRYKGSVLGLCWSILTPLFMAVIYVFFFRLLIGRVSIEGIVIGVFAWQFTVHSMHTGMLCITGNGNLIKKVLFPRSLIPISVTLSGLVDFIISLVVQFLIIGILLIHKEQFFAATGFLLPTLIILHTLFNMALALLFSACNVYFRDTQHLVGLLTSAWFFTSPIMYDIDFVRIKAAENPWIADLFMMNPLSIIITGYRAMLLPNVIFPWNVYSLTGIILSFLFIILSCFVFKKAQVHFADFV